MSMMQIVGKELTPGKKNDKINCIMNNGKDAIDSGGNKPRLCWIM